MLDHDGKPEYERIDCELAKTGILDRISISPSETKDEAAIVYHAGGKLYLYTLKDGSTKKVSTDDNANYIYPHGEATPK